MKDFILGFIFIIWILITGILMLSIIGWVILVKTNNTFEFHYGEKSRTVWMQFGYDLKEYFIKK